MQSILNGINKKDALLLLKALDQYAFTYYEYKDGSDIDYSLSSIDKDTLMNLTEKLSDKVGIDTENY